MGWRRLPSKAGCRPTEPELLDGLCRYCPSQAAPPEAQHPLGDRARKPRANNLDTLTEPTGPISSIGRYCVVKVAGDTPC
jgi:hypothetical protein